MITQNLHINSLTPAIYQRYIAYLSAIDTKDITAYGVFLAEDCVMISNNNPPATGKAEILAYLGEYWNSFTSLEHDLRNIFGTDDAFVLEAWNHYERKDGKKVSVRAVAITEQNEGGLVTSVRLYTDASPVFAS